MRRLPLDCRHDIVSLMLGWFVGFVVVVTAYFVVRARVYRRLFTEAHLLEIADAVRQMKQSALESGPDDGRVFVSRVGLIVAYTVRQHEGRFVHHCSVSMKDGPTTHAVGSRFVAFVAQLLGLPIERMACEIHASTVHHGEVALDDAEQQAFCARSVPTIATTLAAFREGSEKRLKWQRVGSAGHVIPS